MYTCHFVFRVFDAVCTTMIFASWVAVILFFKLSVIVGRKLGLSILPQEEIPFYPFRLNRNRIIFISVELFCRVQLPSPTRILTVDNSIMPRGFSFNLALLTWAIASGFLLEFFESLLLTGQMKPKFEGFVNTRRDLIDKEMTLGRVEYLIEHQIIIMLTIQFLCLINNG